MSRPTRYEYCNPEQKKQYIDMCESERGMIHGPLERLFTSTCSYEMRFRKDVSMFSVFEIRSMYKGFGYHSREALLNANSQLSHYTSWCMEHDSDAKGANPYISMQNNLDYLIDEAALDRRIISRKDLLNSMTVVENDCDRFMLLAMFEGIQGRDKQELLNLRLGDFHREEGTWYVDLFSEIMNKDTRENEIIRRTIAVSDKLKELADIASLQEAYKTPGSDRTTVFSNKQFSDSVIKLVLIYTSVAAKNPSNRGNVIHTRFSNLMSVLKVSLDDDRAFKLCELQPTSLLHSGMLHMIGEIADREQISMKEVLYDPKLVDEVDRQFNSNLKTTKAVFCRKYANYMK